MIKIADIKGLKLNITWKLLYRGLLEKQISINEIVEYAKEQLEKGEDRIEICELAGSGDYDLEDVMDTLYELANEEENPDDIEDRKIRAARVNKFLKDKNTNCIDGLMGLTELWLELGYTADSPHIIQGKDNSISPISYFVQDEIINNISDTPVIIDEGMGISIYNQDFDENNMNVTVDGKFKFWKSENAILVLKDDIEERVLNAYRINDLNNLLFLGDDFVGIEFKNLNQEEMIEIKNSKCLL